MLLLQVGRQISLKVYMVKELESESDQQKKYAVICIGLVAKE
ncbi:MAG: hypothetical protein JWP37_4022 [Mucilaginibacter sp.]|nr:hypothetical protein [Mucilaginibacter sp.]